MYMRKINTISSARIVCWTGLLFFMLIGIPLLAQKKKDYISPLAEKSKKKPKKERTYAIGYRGFLEAGAVAEDFNFDRIHFGGGFTSHGIYLNNASIGLGFGIDKYDSLIMRPIAVDCRFMVGNQNIYDKETGVSQPKKSNFFLFFSTGSAVAIGGAATSDPKGLFFQGGMGFLLGTQKDVRATLMLSYKYQELKDSINPPPQPDIQSLNLRLGIQYKS